MSSSTTAPAASPSTRPLRLRENGRQVSRATTRSASQLRMKPSVSGASQPPATQTSSMPPRIIWKPTPMAWVADAQAEAMLKDGPRICASMQTWLAGALGIARGTKKGCTRGLPSPYMRR